MPPGTAAVSRFRQRDETLDPLLDPEDGRMADDAWRRSLMGERSNGSPPEDENARGGKGNAQSVRPKLARQIPCGPGQSSS